VGQTVPEVPQTLTAENVEYAVPDLSPQQRDTLMGLMETQERFPMVLRQEDALTLPVTTSDLMDVTTDQENLLYLVQTTCTTMYQMVLHQVDMLTQMAITLDLMDVTTDQSDLPPDLDQNQLRNQPRNQHQKIPMTENVLPAVDLAPHLCPQQRDMSMGLIATLERFQMVLRQEVTLILPVTTLDLMDVTTDQESLPYLAQTTSTTKYPMVLHRVDMLTQMATTSDLMDVTTGQLDLLPD